MRQAEETGWALGEENRQAVRLVARVPGAMVQHRLGDVVAVIVAAAQAAG